MQFVRAAARQRRTSYRRIAGEENIYKKRGRPAWLLLVGRAFGRDGRGHAEDGGENFQNDAAIENPKKESDERRDQGEQALYRSLLKREHYPGDSRDEPREQVNGVQEFQHSWCGVQTKCKIHQSFPHTFCFRHFESPPCKIEPKTE